MFATLMDDTRVLGSKASGLVDMLWANYNKQQNVSS